MRTIILLGVLQYSTLSHAWVIDRGDFNTWFNNLSPKNSVYTELEKYFVDQDMNSKAADVQSYIQNFVLTNHQSFKNSVLQLLQNSSSSNLKCHSDSEIDFPENITNIKIGEDFESQALRIETMDCLGKIDHNKVFSTLMSDAFQKKSVSGLQDMQSDQSNNLVCQKTSIFPIGKSSYCFTQNIWQNENTYVIQSFNETNNNGASSPVYFREVFTVIKKTSSGEVFIYNLAIGRGPDLPFHSIVKATVRNQQQSMIQQLIDDSK